MQRTFSWLSARRLIFRVIWEVSMLRRATLQDDWQAANEQDVDWVVYLDLQTQFFKPRSKHLRQLIVSKLCLVECGVQVVALAWLNPNIQTHPKQRTQHSSSADYVIPRQPLVLGTRKN